MFSHCKLSKLPNGYLTETKGLHKLNKYLITGVFAYFAMSLSFADKDFKGNKHHNCSNVKDHGIFRRRKRCHSSCFCAPHFTEKNRSWQSQLSRILFLQSTYVTKREQLSSRNPCFSDKMLKYLVNFKMPQFLKQLHPALLQTRQNLCRLAQRAITTTCESSEASREEWEDHGSLCRLGHFSCLMCIHTQ